MRCSVLGWRVINTEEYLEEGNQDGGAMMSLEEWMKGHPHLTRLGLPYWDRWNRGWDFSHGNFLSLDKDTCWAQQRWSQHLWNTRLLQRQPWLATLILWRANASTVLSLCAMATSSAQLSLKSSRSRVRSFPGQGLPGLSWWPSCHSKLLGRGYSELVSQTTNRSQELTALFPLSLHHVNNDWHL